MQKLLDFYRRWLKILTAFFAFIIFLLVQYIIPSIPTNYLPTSISAFLKNRLISIGVLSFLFFLIEHLLRTIIWKWFFPSLNLSGSWYGETFYTQLEQYTSKVTLKDFQVVSSFHDVYIHQDCLSLSIKPSKGKDFTDWGSITAVVDNDSNLDFLYWVNYGKNDKFPNSANGYEHLSATIFQKPSRRGQPILLTGKFGHCVGGEKPIYSGKTIFIRKGFEHLVEIEDLPDWAKSDKLANFLKTGKRQ